MPANQRKYHRTVIQVEVLSEEPYTVEDLKDVSYDISEGHCSGQVEVLLREEVDGTSMAKLLLEQGSDPEFFRLDGDGNDLDDVLARERS